MKKLYEEMESQIKIEKTKLMAEVTRDFTFFSFGIN